MKRMCKFIFGIIFSIFMMGIISCSGQDESTNLTIAIDMSGLLPSNESKDSFARSVNDEKDESYEIKLINLETNEKYSKTGSIINNEIHVTFEKVPLFFKGRIEAIIFEGETPKFTGRSEEFTVHEGRNRILLTLKEVDNPGDDPADPDDPEAPADPNDPNQPGDGTGEGSGDTGGDNPADPDDPEAPADPNDPNQPGDGTGDDSGETGGDKYELNITIPSYSDLNDFEITENNSTLSVTIPKEYIIEGWYVNGQKIDSPKDNEGKEITEGITSNHLQINEGGIYTIMIIVKETNGTKLYSAECQLEVTK